MKRFLLLLLAPGLGCAAAETPVVRVVPELAVERHIHAGPFHLGELERDRYFRSYHPPGLFSEERNRELREIGAMPGRGSYRIDLPLPPDDPEEIVRTMEEGRVKSSHHAEPYEAIYRRIPPDFRAPHAIAHGRYPVWMREGVDLGQLQASAVEDWEAIGLGNVLRRDLYPSVAEGVVRLFTRWKGLGVDYPRYYTVQNEPIWQWQTEDLAAFHNRRSSRYQKSRSNS